MLGSCNKKLENTKSSHEIKLGELKDLIAGFSYQQTSILQALQQTAGETSAGRDKFTAKDDYAAKTCETCEEGQLHHRTHRPKRDFPYFMVKMCTRLYKCDKYFDMEKIIF